MKPLVAALFCTLLASCAETGAPEIAVREAWARPTLTPAQPGAVYLRIVNTGQAGDRLQAVTSERGRASLHNSSQDNGVVRMRPVAGGLEIPAGATVELKPNGTHIMLEALGAPLAAGSRFPIELQFEKSGKSQLQVTVVNGPAESHGGH